MTEAKKILVLHAYHYGMRWTAQITSGIESVFTGGEAPDCVLHYEFMDTKRISSAEYFAALANLYAMKFRTNEFDLILASDDDALRFLLQYRHRLFHNTPVVFCGVNYFRPEMLEGQRGITGVVESYDLAGTLDVALALHPEARRVLVINDQSATGLANNRRVLEIVARYKDRAEFSFLGPLSMEELLDELRGLPKDTLILLMTFNQDRRGRVFQYRALARLVCSNTSLPVYGVWAFFLGDGIVGGSLTSGETHGRAAAAMGRRILEGEPPENIPVQFDCPSQYMFDHVQLQRFNIDPSRLPAGSLVINRPEQIYRVSQRAVWIGVGALGLLGGLILLYGWNVSQRYKAQRALQRANEQVQREIAERLVVEQEREQLAVAVAQMADGVVLADARGIIQYVNPALEQMTGHSAAELVGQGVRLFNWPGQTEPVPRIMEAMRKGEPWRGRMRTRRKDGQMREEDVVISPLRDASGNIQQFLAIRRDVTEYVALQNQLMEAQKIETVGEIAGGIAHDFNNMLTVILTGAQFLADALPPDSKHQKEAQEILRTARLASGLTRELLTFCRRQPIDLKPHDVNAVIRGMQAMLHHLLGERIRLVLETGPAPLMARVDKPRLEQAVANLVTNARDAIQGPGQVTVGVGQTTLEAETLTNFVEPPPPDRGAFIRVTVRDTGSGMTAEIRRRIFEPFFTTKPPGEGTGLGLPVVYGIVKQHGGYLAVDTAPGRGSAVTFYLPALSGVPEDLSASRSCQPVPGGRETVLLVEDEASVCEVTARILTSLGYRVWTADSAEAALALLQKAPESAQVLLTDIVMPGMDGVSLAREAMRRHPGLRVIFMSGYSQEHWCRDPELASVALLKKPFEVGELADLLRRVLDASAPLS